MQNIARAPCFALAVLALAVTVAGCGAAVGSGSSATDVPGSAGTVHVVMKSLFFTPTDVHAKVGQRVVWTNRDSSPHNVEYVSGPRFTSSRPVLRPGARFSIGLTAPGTIHYYCSIHPWMKATITVSQ